MTMESRRCPGVPATTAEPSLTRRSRVLCLLVFLSLTLPFLDTSRIVLIAGTDMLKAGDTSSGRSGVGSDGERRGPFLVTDGENGAVVTVRRRPQLFNVTAPLHVVKTSLLQDGRPRDTKWLGWAQFKVLKNIALPSMLGQSSRNFAWLIFVDPNVSRRLIQAIVDLLRPHHDDHFYLILDDDTSRAYARQFAGGMELAERLDWEDVIVGNVQRLRYMLQQRDRFPYLETHMDVDHALHKHFVQQIQEQAMQVLGPEKMDWAYWCVSQTLEWYWMGSCAVSIDQRLYGALLPSPPYRRTCHTPTLGLFRASQVDQAVVVHDDDAPYLYPILETTQMPCGPYIQGRDCLLSLQHLGFGALHVRSPTLAAASNPTNTTTDFVLEAHARRLATWSFARYYFKMRRSKSETVIKFWDTFMTGILQDQEMQLCTEGPFCQDKVKMKVANAMRNNHTCFKN